jgi:protein-S-isoprenylcysteine O-methyltransferase
MAFGIGLRYYAMGVLGREFSLHVRVRPDQRVVDTGPYRWLRHPAYSGGWLALVGAALTLHNWAAVLVMAGLAFVGFGQRIRVEEAVLTDIFGDRYRAYQQHTWRMFPFLY